MGAVKPSSWRTVGWQYGVVALWVFVLFVARTWPMATDPSRMVVGHPEASVGCHVWVLWWAQQGMNQLHTDLIFYPSGADVVQLYGSDLLSPFVLGFLPMSPGFLYNLWVLFLTVVGGVGVARLVRFMDLNWVAAGLGASIFAVAPFFQHELINGTSEMVAASALPWFAFALLKTLSGAEKNDALLRDGALTGLIAGLAVASSAYNLFMVSIVTTVLVVHRLVVSGEPLFVRSVQRALGLGVGVAGWFGMPLAWVQLRHGIKETYASRSLSRPDEQPLPDAFADLLDWFDPSAAEIPAVLQQPGGGVFEYWTTCTVYIGIVVILLSLLCLAKSRKLGAFGWLFVVGFLLAMGPHLRVDGEALSLWGNAIPLPTALLVELVPPFQITALHAYRYSALVVLGLSVLGARGSALLPGWAAWLSILLVVMESALVSPVSGLLPTTAIPRSPTLDALAVEPDGGVLHLPIEKENLGDLGRLLMAQTVHGKPVQDGGIHRRAGENATTLFADSPMLGELARPGGAKYASEKEALWGFVHLTTVGYRYVLVSDEEPEAVDWVAGVLGPPKETDGRWSYWMLPLQAEVE